ncbi:MAG: 50S ribosomal protein L23 [Thermoflexales bacterium]|nr:50S ribosomal protein L23 [Thermoflexales bacterium]
MHPYQVLLKPLVTEKTQWQVGYEQPQYAFQVSGKANKAQIKEAVELAFNVTVTRVNILNMPAKRKRNPRTRGATQNQITRVAQWKKAVVQVRKGDRIPLFEGVA